MPDHPIIESQTGDNSTNIDMQHTIVLEIAERVRAVAAAKRFNAKSLGEELGIPSSTAANYWSGKRPWPIEFVAKLAEVVDAPLSYILGGEINAGAKGQRKSDRSDHPSVDMVDVAQIDLRFGLGAAIMDQEIVEAQADVMSFPRTWLRLITNSPPQYLYWARGQGDSMGPTINDDDVILIDRSQNSLRIADLCWAFAYGQTGMIKRLRPMPDGGVKILSDNPSVPPEIAYDSELHIFGRVIAVIKKV